MSQAAHPIPQPSGILTVAENRGFVVETSDPLMGRLVITAAQCLPTLPATENAAVFPDESTYPDLLGPLGQTPTVWAQCLFVDPVSDLAVLASPDNQALFDQWQAYQNLLKSVSPFPASDAPSEGQAWLYSLDRRWFPCRIRRVNQGPLRIFDAVEPIRGGMFGSPIKADDGAVIGLVSRSSAGLDDDALKKLRPGDLIDADKHVVAGSHPEGGPQPVLARSLPAWLRNDLLERRPERLSTADSENMISLARIMAETITSLIGRGLRWPIYCVSAGANGAILGIRYHLNQHGRPAGQPVAEYYPDGTLYFRFPIQVFLTDGKNTARLMITESGPDAPQWLQ
jgi:hypothetical protein